MAEVIGRFAPTPSGRLHLGNILCAMLAWLSAKSQGGKCLLRIEDVDVPRCPARFARQCVEDLTWLGFHFDGPILYQSERTALYEQAERRLTAAGLTYPCFCTRAQLHPERAPNLGDTQMVYPGTCARLSAEEIERLSHLRRPAVRLRVPDETLSFCDLLAGYVTENLQRDCGDFVLRRSDGLFGYQLACVVDDALTGVTEIVRGRDILTATPRQMYLQRCLGYATPQYIHIPLLTDGAGRRLAKRDADLGLDVLSRRMTAEEILGALAWACGLQSEPRPTALEMLAADFRWERIPREDLRLPAELRGSLTSGGATC